MNLSNVNEKSFVDIPSSTPAVSLPLQRVGVSNRPLYIKVLDPFGDQALDLWSSLKVFFTLPANQRGLHMSRIEEAINFLRNSPPNDYSQYAICLSNKLIELQKIQNCEIFLTSEYEKISNKNKSGHESAELIKLHHNVRKDRTGIVQTVGVSVPFINACPCTQRWAIREFHNSLISQQRTEDDIAALVEIAPKQAHTNRGQATVMIESDQVTHPEIYNILDNSVPIIRELLKGLDEHEMVRNAHQQGMFCEDNIRTITSIMTRELSTKLPASTKVSISVEVDESVHHHNLLCEVSETLEHFATILKA